MNKNTTTLTILEHDVRPDLLAAALAELPETIDTDVDPAQLDVGAFYCLVEISDVGDVDGVPASEVGLYRIVDPVAEQESYYGFYPRLRNGNGLERLGSLIVPATSVRTTAVETEKVAIDRAVRAYLAAREKRLALKDALDQASRELEIAARSLYESAGTLRRAAQFAGVGEWIVRYDARLGTKGRRSRKIQ